LLNQQKVVERILSNVEKNYIVFDDRCVFLKHKKSDCNLCVNYCPAEAIRLNRITKKVSIDPDKCIECGICTNICPTEVFKSTHFREREIFTKGKTLLELNRNLEVKCAQNDEADSDRTLEVNCLGFIHQSHILGLIALGADVIHFRHAECQKCEKKFGKELISKTIKEVNALLRPYYEKNAPQLTSGTEPTAFSSNSEKIENLTAEGNDIDKVTRREFIASLIKKGRYSVAYSLNLVLRKERHVTRKRSNFTDKHLPATRKLLLAALNNLDSPVDTFIDTKELTGITDLEIISDQCSVCPSCSNFCPTGALTRTEVKNKRGKTIDATLFFNSSQCTKCGLCLVACFTNAMHYSDQLSINSFISEQPRILQEKPQEIL